VTVTEKLVDSGMVPHPTKPLSLPLIAYDVLH